MGTAGTTVGDALTDMEAARAVGIPFVGRVPPGEADPFGLPHVTRVPDLAALDARWEEFDAEPPPVP